MQVYLILGLVCSAFATETSYPTVDKSEFDCSQVSNPGVDHFHPNVNDCNTFYRCVPGHELAYLYTCNDPNEVFDEAAQMCVNKWDTYPPCGTKQTTTAWTGPTQTITTTTENPNAFYCDNLADGFYPNPHSCSSFYICNNDVPDGVAATPVPCPAGLVYNPELFYCDWPYNVPPPCGTKTRQTRDQVAPACEDHERFECNGAQSVVRDADCVTFYNCDANIQRPCPSKCPPGLVYNIEAGYCDFSYNVLPPCGTAGRVARNDGAACEDDERFECNGATEIVPDPDCVTFYNCDENIQRPCPSKCIPGLVFNTEVGYCDYAYNVAPPCGSKTY